MSFIRCKFNAINIVNHSLQNLIINANILVDAVNCSSIEVALFDTINATMRNVTFTGFVNVSNAPNASNSVVSQLATTITSNAIINGCKTNVTFTSSVTPSINFTAMVVFNSSFARNVSGLTNWNLQM